MYAKTALTLSIPLPVLSKLVYMTFYHLETHCTVLVTPSHLCVPLLTLQCSASCGKGFKERKVNCVTRSGRLVPDENCLHLPSKPKKQRNCRGSRCSKWKPGSWGKVLASQPAIKHSHSTSALSHWQSCTHFCSNPSKCLPACWFVCL